MMHTTRMGAFSPGLVEIAEFDRVLVLNAPFHFLTISWTRFGMRNDVEKVEECT